MGLASSHEAHLGVFGALCRRVSGHGAWSHKSLPHLVGHPCRRIRGLASLAPTQLGGRADRHRLPVPVVALGADRSCRIQLPLLRGLAIRVHPAGVLPRGDLGIARGSCRQARKGRPRARARGAHPDVAGQGRPVHAGRRRSSQRAGRGLRAAADGGRWSAGRLRGHRCSCLRHRGIPGAAEARGGDHVHRCCGRVRGALSP